jgi:hypothetical protein
MPPQATSGRIAASAMTSGTVQRPDEGCGGGAPKLGAGPGRLPGIVIVWPQLAHGPDLPAKWSATSVCFPQ